jgi:hypothetical protein
LIVKRLIFLFCAFLTGHGAAATEEPVPQDYWQRVGSAQLSVLFLDVYESRLYSEDGRYSEGQRPLRLDIQYKRDISARRLLEQTRKEWRHLGVSSEHIMVWSRKLEALWPDVKKGDLLSFVIDEHGVGRFSYNDAELGALTDPVLTKRFLDIWLSPDTSRPEHRQQLLSR